MEKTLLGRPLPESAARQTFGVASKVAALPNLHASTGFKLQREWPGILRWAINGALQWQLHGLPRPKALVDATSAYLSAAQEDASSERSYLCREHGAPTGGVHMSAA
jgi:hypothetical protein